MSLYTHHRAGQRDIDAIIEGGGEDDNGNIEREEWDYDVNRLLHATWILYAYAMVLHSILYLVLRLSHGSGGGGGGSVGAIDDGDDV